MYVPVHYASSQSQLRIRGYCAKQADGDLHLLAHWMALLTLLMDTTDYFVLGIFLKCILTHSVVDNLDMQDHELQSAAVQWC